jgi:hypothetical protein
MRPHVKGHGVLKGYWISNIVYDYRLVRVMRCFRVMLYEARDKVYCESYKDESGHEPIISMYIRARRLWIKWSHRDRSSGWEVLSFWLRNHEYEAKIVIYKTVYGQIAPWTSISTISIIHGISYKGPWGIGRLSEVDYGIWPQIRMVFCRIKDIVIFWKKIVSRCQSARRLSAPDFHPRTLHYWLLHLLCAVRKNVLVEQTIQR